MTDSATTAEPLYRAAALVDFADALLTRAGLAPHMARSVAQTLVPSATSFPLVDNSPASIAVT